jgi:hypothetical protein
MGEGMQLMFIYIVSTTEISLLDYTRGRYIGQSEQLLTEDDNKNVRWQITRPA